MQVLCPLDAHALPRCLRQVTIASATRDRQTASRTTTYYDPAAHCRLVRCVDGRRPWLSFSQGATAAIAPGSRAASAVPQATRRPASVGPYHLPAHAKRASTADYAFRLTAAA
jgi:hypothetical protein